VPAVVMTIALAARGKEVAFALAASTAAAILLVPLGVVLYDALGGQSLVMIAVLMALFTTTIAPALLSFRVAAVAAGGALLLAIVAATLPAYTTQRPRPLTLVYVDDAAQPGPVWATNLLTPELGRVAKFGETSAAAMPWQRVPIRWSSQRNASRISLIFRSDAPVNGIRINGVVPPPRPERSREPRISGWQFVTVWGTGADVEIMTTGKVEAVASDTTFGLPAEGAALVGARTESLGAPVHDGDVTITRTRAVW
jgi:hypothetical protein